MVTAPLPDSDECCDETPVPVDGVFDLELGSEVRSVSETMPPPLVPGGMGDRDGLERCDICEAEREFGGSDDSDVFRACADAISPWMFMISGVSVGVGTG